MQQLQALCLDEHVTRVSIEFGQAYPSFQEPPFLPWLAYQLVTVGVKVDQ